MQVTLLLMAQVSKVRSTLNLRGAYFGAKHWIIGNGQNDRWLPSSPLSLSLFGIIRIKLFWNSSKILHYLANTTILYWCLVYSPPMAVQFVIGRFCANSSKICLRASSLVASFNCSNTALGRLNCNRLHTNKRL
jgi:hypothetical protein